MYKFLIDFKLCYVNMLQYLTWVHSNLTKVSVLKSKYSSSNIYVVYKCRNRWEFFYRSQEVSRFEWTFSIKKGNYCKFSLCTVQLCFYSLQIIQHCSSDKNDGETGTVQHIHHLFEIKIHNLVSKKRRFGMKKMHLCDLWMFCIVCLFFVLSQFQFYRILCDYFFYYGQSVNERLYWNV